MKTKLIYILVLLCGFNFFSAAKQTGGDCKKSAADALDKKACINMEREDDGLSFDLSPLHLFWSLSR
ncbi:MAG TPA: hypothetical protein VFX58_09800 [Chitinophagaceae bacterium]|nr:hypothetical protein [Chitinophagaceae bacterium]